MKKLAIGCLMLMAVHTTALADHITGGEMFYTCTGLTNGQYNYQITAKLFMDCYSNRRLPDPAIFGIFNKSGAHITDISVPMANQQGLQLTNPSPCITNPPAVCYQIGHYNFNVSLPASAEGYIIVIQVVYRVQGISNLIPGYGNIGATYTGEIPGNASLSTAPQNNSAHFIGDDMVVICANNSFSYSFAAEDKDNDQLRYSFCNALIGGAGGGGTNFPPAPPPYASVPYGANYGPSGPLGNNVKIDPNTGLITGIAPGEGIYVVTVCVDEIRNGVVIATQRKDLQIRITACTIASASMQPEYMMCKNTKTINLANMSTSPLITSTNWELFNADGVSIFNSASTTTSYTFPDTGLYKIKLVINRNKQCSDSAWSLARVYPGFIPDFSVNGICFTKPTRFTDASSSYYGLVNSWSWDFGDVTFNDTSNLPSSTYTYTSMGLKNIRLIATDTKGCHDTALKNISILDKPPLSLAFRDTLICVPDAVQLMAIGNGIFSWTPGTTMINGNTANPTVSPGNTITYYVNLDDNGCLNRDSVKVRVVDHVTLKAMNDTIICRSDTIRLHLTSDGLQYSWTPASQVLNTTAPNPQVVTYNTTPYTVTAHIGSCSASDQIVVTTVPYPVANAGTDTTVCFATSAQLHGSTESNTFSWLPAPSLSNLNILNPIADPHATTSYVLSVYETRGCPKPGFDTVVVIVMPDINAYCGRDTTVITGQSLQLNATGGVAYRWKPATGLSNATIANPMAVYTAPSTGISYKVYVYNEAGCVDSASIKVKIYQTPPSVFVPNAFTPNSDGKNDLLRPIAAGIAKIEAFQIYNRWGQRVFSTTVSELGWDGTIAGKPQPSGTYVWMVKAVDHTGAPYMQRGTLLLIR
jgi:gliding motility-associated-like protein